jgi:hypothetical protein
VGLLVLAALGADALMARVSAARRWPRVNVIVAPVALIAVATPLLAIQLVAVSRQADRVASRLAAVSAAVRARLDAEADTPAALMTDHPMWLAGATDRPAIVLPDEPPESVTALAATYDAAWLVVFDGRGRYPRELLDVGRRACLVADPESIGPAGDPAWLFRLSDRCAA